MNDYRPECDWKIVETVQILHRIAQQNITTKRSSIKIFFIKYKLK